MSLKLKAAVASTVVILASGCNSHGKVLVSGGFAGPGGRFDGAASAAVSPGRSA
jgi:hypothetical protein